MIDVALYLRELNMLQNSSTLGNSCSTCAAAAGAEAAASSGSETMDSEKTSLKTNRSSGFMSEEDSAMLQPSMNSGDIYSHFNWDLHVEGENDSGVDLSTSTRKYPTVFRWNGDGTDVCLSGSFNNWRQKIPLVKSEGEFYTVVNVPEGTHQYKFFVDGEWTCHPNEPKVDNDVGTQNNVVTIHNDECDIYHVLMSDSLGAAYVDPLASPPGNYSQHVPVREASFGFHRLGPPLLPPQLVESVLNETVPAHCEPMMVPEPSHVVLNHLYTLSIKGGIMVLSTTHRYRKKYVTTLLYKPI